MRSVFCHRCQGENNIKQLLLEFYNLLRKMIKKSNLHYASGITPKRVTSVEVHLYDIAIGQPRNIEGSGKGLATVPIRPVSLSNPRPLAPIAMYYTATSTGA